MLLTVPKQIGLKLDPDTRARLEAYMATNNRTISQAVRVLLAVALREDEAADQAFRRAAFREGITAGVAAYSRSITEAIKSAAQTAFSELERY